MSLVPSWWPHSVDIRLSSLIIMFASSGRRQFTEISPGTQSGATALVDGARELAGPQVGLAPHNAHSFRRLFSQVIARELANL